MIAVHPRVSLHLGPSYVVEGSNVTLPACHVTGYPAPVVTWRKLSGQLPHGRARYNNTALQISNVRKVDSDAYFCSAVNLLGNVERKTLLAVVSLPEFTVKPPGNVAVGIGTTLTLNCSAIGDPRPVITWKRQGATLPVGRSYRANDALVLSDLKKEDAGIYVCVATSAGVFHIETISYVEVRKPRGKLFAQKESKSVLKFLRQTYVFLFAVLWRRREKHELIVDLETTSTSFSSFLWTSVSIVATFIFSSCFRILRHLLLGTRQL